MRLVKSTLIGLTLLAIFAGSLWFFVRYYSFLFSERVTGIVRRVDVRDTRPVVPNSNGETPSALSCAVAVQTKTGEIFTSACEDQEWSVVTQGDCVEAVFYPYPPWNLEKAGTYLNARLKKQFECGVEFAKDADPAPASAEQL